jgi:hypothetical protein
MPSVMTTDLTPCSSIHPCSDQLDNDRCFLLYHSYFGRNGRISALAKPTIRWQRLQVAGE